jgi:2,4-dienoyl-CoA reductase-like NADH-dependent reductase (Old Yellow Enzyme family)
MSRHEPFRYRNIEELLRKAEAMGVELPFQDSIAPLFHEAEIAGRRVPNRLAVQPMEGFDSSPAGAPGELTFRRYRRYAEGGNGLIWFEACSISPSGRSNPSQLLIRKATLQDFQRLVEITRRAAIERFGLSHDPYLVLQLTHSGRFSRNEAQTKPKVARFNPHFDKSIGDVEVVRDAELAGIRDQFVAAAVLAQQAGFDAVDIKACHGYLLHELLSAFTRTNSDYGGEFEGRTRLLLEIVGQIRRAAPGLSLAVRLNATDGIPFPFGFGVDRSESAQPDLSEPLRLQQLLIDAGCVLFNITAGIPFFVPHLGRPFDRPARGAKHPDVHPLRSVGNLIRWAGAFQQACPSSPVVGTGYSWLRHFWPNVGAAVVARKAATFVGLGRSSFAYPDAPLDLMKGGKLDPAKCCNACSCCTDLMRNSQITGCVIRDRAIYKSAYGNIKK